jgi:GNAT superfamily N-acetyltransferase
MTRPWASTDADAVASLVAAAWPHDALARSLFSVHGPARAAPGAFSRTVVDEVDGAVVGVGTVREYWLHPARWRIALHVAAPHRRRGIGSALLACLLAMVPAGDARPIQAATRADDLAGRAFLRRHGFRLVMRTRLGLLDPAHVGQDRWAEMEGATRRVEVAGYRIEPVPDLASDPARRRALAALHAEVYRLAHRWNPPAPSSEEDAATLFLGEDLLPDALFIATAAGTSVAVASLRRGAHPAEVELGWVGASGAHRSRADDLVAALAGACLDRALASGRAVRVEVDEADRPLWRLVDALPVAWEPDWLTFARTAAPARPSR